MKPVQPLPIGTLNHNGQYRIEQPIDQNGFVITYRATRTDDERPVLLKEFCHVREDDERLTGELPLNKGKMSAQRLRFLFEHALLNGHKPHELPGMVQLLESYCEQNKRYLVLAFVPGQPLHSYLENCPQGIIGPGEAMRLVRQLALVLSEWYDTPLDRVSDDVLYRLNIHTHNIIRKPTGQPVLLHIGSDLPVMGFLPPELFGHAYKATPATPVYALGALLYRLITGQLPPDGPKRRPGDKLPGLLPNPNIPSGLAAVVIKSLQANGAQRYANVRELAAALSSIEPDVEESNPKAVLTETVNGVSFDMILIRGGSFMMGSDQTDSDLPFDWDQPAHEVRLDDYYLCETVVTVALWRAVMQGDPHEALGPDECPVEGVNWYDAQKFIRQLNYETGRFYRLPTEAEWEYAAKGGAEGQRLVYAGSNRADEVAWFRDNAQSSLRPVKQKKPNELGLYDMSGNVWEWCQDWFGPYAAHAQHNPTGPENGVYRVARGGCYFDRALLCRSSERRSDYPNARYGCPGFRLALSRS